MKKLISVVIVLFCIQLIYAQEINVGKMYFSSKPFGNGHDGEVSKFSMADNIYARMEIDAGTIESAFGTDKNSSDKRHTLKVVFKIFKNGVDLNHYASIPRFLYVSPDDKKHAALNFDIRPSLAQASSFYVPEDRRDDNYTTPSDFYSLPFKNGDYTIKVIIQNGYDYGKTAIIAGTFDFTYSDANGGNLRNEEDALVKKLRQSASSLSKLPTALVSPAKSGDPEVSYEKIKSLLRASKPGIIILKVGLEQPNGSIWSVGNNEDGTIRQKSFMQNVVYAFKEDGKCKIGTFYLRKAYLGHGRYDKVSIGTFSEEVKTIDCAKVK